MRSTALHRSSIASIRLLAALACAVLLTACGTTEPAAGSGDSGDSGDSGETSGEGGGEPTDVENIATYDGEDRQEVLEAAAAEEGLVRLYTNPTTEITDALIEGFTNRYPDIEVEVTRGSSTELAQKIAEEYNAGLHQMDVVETSVSVLTELQRAGITQAYHTPEAQHFSADAQNADGYYVSSRESHIALGYNTDLLSEDEIPTTHEDLLDPAYQGRMALPGSATGARFIANLEMEYGEEFIQQLAEQDVTLQNISGRALADLIVSGEVALSPAIYDSHMTTSSEEGAPVAWYPLEPVIALPTGPSLAAEAEHPHAALLYIDYILSEEGQQIYLDNGYQSAREDLDSPGGDYEKVYIDTRDDYLERLPEWEGMLQQYFVGG